uniref:Uncharacterized protein n=1 Tax=Amphimedon queenslandica TaxID=400682 RepID=A0A1X7UP85_AMPQE
MATFSTHGICPDLYSPAQRVWRVVSLARPFPSLQSLGWGMVWLARLVSILTLKAFCDTYIYTGRWGKSIIEQVINAGMTGTWYNPDRTTVPPGSADGNNNPSPLFANNTATGQIGLLRNGGIASIQGLYSCVIPNEEGIDQTLYVAAYGNADFLKDDELPMIDGHSPSFQLLSSVDADPPVFSLSFNVTNRSPTIVTCSVDNGNQFNVSDSYLIHTVITNTNTELEVQALAMFRMRVSGLYACSVTTDRITTTPLVSTNMAVRNITVTGPPSDLTYNRDNNLLSVTLGWSPSAGISATPQYHVFVNNSYGIIMNDNTTNTELSLSLRPDDEYNIRLVATGEDLPSEIITVTIPQVVSIDVQGPVMMPLDHSSSFSLTCTLTLAPEVNDTTVQMFWAGPDLIPFKSTTDGDIALDSLEPTMISVNDSVVYTLTLNFSSLQASQVGEYVCETLLNDSIDTIILTSNYTISVQVPTPMVTASVNTTGHIFESNDIQLLCIVTITPLDVNQTVDINWFGPNGLITMNDAKYSISTGIINSINYESNLTFTASLLDNGTDYYCTASVGPTSTVNGFELILPATAMSTNTTVIAEIVPLPMVSVMDVGIPVTGDPFQLVCTGTAPANVSSIATVSVQWLLNGTVFTNDKLEGVTVTNSGFMATLSFSSLNASTHERDDYTCAATLSIPDVLTTKTASIMYNLLTLTNPVVSIFSSQPVFANQSYSLNCTVTIVAGDLNITWLNSSRNELTEGDGISFNLISISDTVQRYDLIFNSINYSDIGVYICKASLTVDRGGGVLFNGTGSANTTVSIRIPIPQVSISPGDNSPFILGTIRTVSCFVVFTPPLPTNPNVSFNVFKDDAQVLFENSSRLIAVQTKTTGALTFQPLNFSDAGNYTCTATARDSANNPLIIPSSASDEYIVTVQAIPVPNITFTTTTGRSLGESLTLNCTVDVLDDLYNINATSSIVRNGELITSTTGSGDTTAMIMIDSLRSSDAGDYQCIVNITQSVPTSSVIVEYNATGHLVDGELAEGQFLDIMCIADISQYIDTSVSVTMSWRRNNTVLTNGSDFTISPPVMTNNQYTGVLRINSLRDELDNGASYNCSVSVTPNTPFIIAGNDNSSAVTLTIARFDINHVDISINIPSVPVADDVFNLSCVIVVPPNFVENLSSVRWTYDLEASQDVIIINNDATLVPVVRNGNIFTSVLTFDPVKTTDARQYYCQATFLVFGTVDRTNRDLTVQISPPSLSIVADPPTGPIYESTSYLLTCTATVNTTIVNTPVTASVVWTDPSGNAIPTNEARRQVIPPTGNSLVSMLLFQPIDTGYNNDGGTYTCQMIINSGNSLIVSSQPTDTTLDVTVESLPPMKVNFSSVGSVEVGQSLTITCTITTVERLVVTPIVTFIQMNETDMEMLSNLNRPYSITTDDTGSVTNYTLILDPVRFEDSGMYTCMAEFNVTGFNNTNDPSTATYDSQEDSDTFTLIVDFPPVIVTISKERDDTLYAGTLFFIKCDIMLNLLVTIPVTITNQWRRDGTNVPMGSSDATITEDLNIINISHFNATLIFHPLDNADDSGMYTCNVEVTAPNSYTYLRNTSASANTSITVIATPEPVVEIVTMGMAEPGEEYMLNCTVTVVDRLIVSPVITWTKRSANNVISVPPVLMTVSNVMSSLYLNFSSLNTSDAGLYTCEASINVSQISIVARSNDTSTLPLEIPIPSVDVSRSRENYFLAGSNLILTCDISVDPNVDTPFTVNVTWNKTDQKIMSSGDFGDESGPSSMRLADTDRVNISPVMMRSRFNEYRSTVNFTTLSSMEDSGTYTCIVTIVAPIYQYITTSDTNYMNVNFTVTDPFIGGFSASPDSFLGLETSCPDSDPYDNFTLTCTATKPTIVIPNLVIAWTHNGTIETGTVTTTGGNMTTTVTNTLSFTNSTAADSGTYRCTASITIPDSTDIATSSEESTVAIRPQSLPVPATNVTVTPGTTTAAVSFIIPNIAYTPETYNVKHTGAILQTTQATSIIRMSSSNITAINQKFVIMLTGLEEDNTYTYTVDSTNCLGTTSTVEMSFRTLPALPVAPPIDCANITFLPRNVTLTWTAPALIDQNGAPFGYNLTCMNTSGISVNGLSPTQTSTNTMFTITDVMPFTGYTCELSFINVVGPGPPTQCTFETAQDKPDDGPQNFTSTPTMTTVTFRWSRPSIPNGIITGYLLKVTNIETSAYHIMNISSDQLMYTLDEEGFLSAYNNYTATVTASTIIGFGPISTTSGRTLPDMSSPPLLVTRDITISGTIFTTLPSVDNHTINVTWSPPTTSNGRIMNYIIDVDGYTNGNNLIRRTITDVDKNSFMELITNTTVLTPGVPYNVTLVAYNEFGRGMPVEVTVFTRVLTPSVSPSGIRGIRSADGTNMTITWNAVSFEQARGFFEYTIRLTRSSRKRQTTGDLVYRVPYRDTSFTATGLDGQATYGVSMGLSVDDGSSQGPIAGPTSEPIEVVSPDPNTCIMDITVSTDRGTFEWPVTISGSTVDVSCPNGPTGAVATRRCVTNSRWESPNITSCATTE